MNPEQSTKPSKAIEYQEVDNAAFTAQVIDTAELTTAELIVWFKEVAAAFAVFRLMQSDVKTNATTLGGTPTEVQDFTKPTSSQDGKIWVINLRRFLDGDHKRYIQLQATAGDGSGTTTKFDATLMAYSKIAGSKAADRGVDSVINVNAVAA